jgi:hypothetical protein
MQPTGRPDSLTKPEKHPALSGSELQQRLEREFPRAETALEAGGGLVTPWDEWAYEHLGISGRELDERLTREFPERGEA